MKELITKAVGESMVFEIKPDLASYTIVAFGRIRGLSLGIVANQPMVPDGCLDIDAPIKAERFVRFYDALDIPTVSFVDVPVSLPGLRQCTLRHHPRGRHSTMCLR